MGRSGDVDVEGFNEDGRKVSFSARGWQAGEVRKFFFCLVVCCCCCCCCCCCYFLLFAFSFVFLFFSLFGGKEGRVEDVFVIAWVHVFDDVRWEEESERRP